MPTTHRLAGREEVDFAEIVDEPAVALPEAAGELRNFWLATDHRDRPPTIGSTAHTADEAIEATAAGLGIVLVAAGNAALYADRGVTTLPVVDLSPSVLALVWRADDHRDVLRDITEFADRRLGVTEDEGVGQGR